MEQAVLEITHNEAIPFYFGLNKTDQTNTRKVNEPTLEEKLKFIKERIKKEGYSMPDIKSISGINEDYLCIGSYI